MAALAPIVIADGASTPVNRTYNPVKINVDGVATLADRSGGIAIGFPMVSVLVRVPSKVSKNYRVSGKVSFPVLEVTAPSTATGIQPAPTKSYELLGTFEFVLPERSTLLDRQHILALTKNFLGNANITNAVTTFETIY